jgi:S1-C subfamily serine protease
MKGLEVRNRISAIAFGLIFTNTLFAASPRKVTPRGPLSPEELANIQVFEEASRSVVFINTVALATDIFSMNVHEVPKGTGSGFFWDNDGHVVTNFHVIRDANVAQVTLSDQTTYKAKLVGAAPEHDLAVLKIDIPRSTRASHWRITHG